MKCPLLYTEPQGLAEEKNRPIHGGPEYTTVEGVFERLDGHYAYIT